MTDVIKPRRSWAPWVVAIVIILALVIGWHLLLPLLGITVAITGGVLSIIVGTIAVLCVTILLFFVFTGVGMFILGALAFIWTILAIILFPIIFPIVVPLLVILLFISFLMRKKS